MEWLSRQPNAATPSSEGQKQGQEQEEEKEEVEVVVEKLVVCQMLKARVSEETVGVMEEAAAAGLREEAAAAGVRECSQMARCQVGGRGGL